MPIGAYKPIIMYFGLTNSPPTFQNMMNNIFIDMYVIVIIYIDNIMIFMKGRTKAEHKDIVEEVLQQLRDNDLFINPENCVSLLIK